MTKHKIVKQKIPGDLLVCDDIPKVPTITMQSEAAMYTAELLEVAEQCKGRLSKIKELVE